MIDCGDFSIIELKLKDAESLNSMLLKNSKRFNRFFPITLSENQNLEMTKEYISNKKLLIDQEKEYTLALKNKVSGSIVGLIIIKNIDRTLGEAEIAYCLDMDFCNKGWITKSVEVIAHLAFDKLDLSSLYILVHKSNKPSTRVAEKSEFNWAKTVLNGYTPPNEEPLNMEYYIRIK